MKQSYNRLYRLGQSTTCIACAGFRRLVPLVMAAAFFASSVEVVAQCAPAGGNTQFTLNGVDDQHFYPFTGLCRAAGPVHVVLQVTADLGCHASDATDCGAAHTCPWPDECMCVNPSCRCSVAPTAKYITLKIGRPSHEVFITSANANQDTATQPYLRLHSPVEPPSGEEGRSWLPVPDDGHFFTAWWQDHPYEKEYGISYCAGWPGQVGPSTNEHRFYIPAATWNGWLDSGTSIRFIVTITGNTRELDQYCAESNCGGDSIPTHSHVEFSYDPLGRCCHADSTCELMSQAACSVAGDAWVVGETCESSPCHTGACCDGDVCTVTTEAGCLVGTWTDGAICSPNPCTADPMGACCYGSGLCVPDTQVRCSSANGTYSGNGTICEPNVCTEPPVIYVDANASGTTHNGTSWTSAYLDLQAAQKVTAGSRLTASST